jgi:hypothetical protein
MYLPSLAIESYDDAVRLYNQNLKRKHKALIRYKKTRRDYETACAEGSTSIDVLKQHKKDAVLDFVAMALIVNEGLVAVDLAMYQIELVRRLCQ